MVSSRSLILRDRKARGICSWCDDPAINSGMCQKHIAISKRNKARLKEERLSANLCILCGKFKQINGHNKCNTCNDRQNNSSIKHANKRKKAGLCLWCNNSRFKNFHLCSACRDKRNEKTNKKNYERKLRLIAAYGGKCDCCGESKTAFLSIDHINNDGKQHREAEVGAGGNPLYRWLEDRGFPKDNFRLLCFNCNTGRNVNGGICPHETERKACHV